MKIGNIRTFGGKMEEIIAVIPARGGSKRVKKKNLYPIEGKPLIAYTIEKATFCGVFHEVYVNSEDEEILRVSKEYGAIPYKRPSILAGDKVFIIEVLHDMIKSLKISEGTTVGILLPTAPLRTEEDILNAFRIFNETGGEAPVVSVSWYPTPIQLAQFITSDNHLEPVFPEDYRRSTRSTDHKKAYYFNEAVIFNSVKNIMSQKNLIGDKPIPYIMPPERSILIDYPFQLKLIEIILKERIILEK